MDHPPTHRTASFDTLTAVHTHAVPLDPGGPDRPPDAREPWDSARRSFLDYGGYDTHRRNRPAQTPANDRADSFNDFRDVYGSSGDWHASCDGLPAARSGLESSSAGVAPASSQKEDRMNPIEDKTTDRVDMNRDPITGSPGSHPAGTALGSAGGAAVGAAAGMPAGPIGMLIGGVIGAVVGAAAGHTAAEALDPTGEVEYWRDNHRTRPYVDRSRNFDTDYKPAYLYGVKVREDWRDRPWDDTVEQELERKWAQTRGTSTLTWPQARPAVYDAWDRANRSYLTYDGYDSFYRGRFDAAEYRDPAYAFPDYRSAYRFGTWARRAWPERSWDDAFDAELARQWTSARGDSTLTWEQARSAARDAWNHTPRTEVG